VSGSSDEQLPFGWVGLVVLNALGDDLQFRFVAWWQGGITGADGECSIATSQDRL
jgi:hypothetical protein